MSQSNCFTIKTKNKGVTMYSSNIPQFEKCHWLDLFTASSLGLVDVVMNLVERGLNINVQNRGGWTALMYACSCRRNKTLLYLLNQGADVSLMDAERRTFISLAAEQGNAEALIMLKEAVLAADLGRNGVSSNTLRLAISKIINVGELKNGFTPLMIAAQLGQNDIVALLVQLGADVLLTDRKGRTAQVLAAEYGHRAVTWKLQTNDENVTVDGILKKWGLEKYRAIFAQTTLEQFLLLEEDDLMKIGIKLLGPRKTILMAIGKL